MTINEDELEQFCIEVFEDIDYEYILGTELEERESPTQVVLHQRLQDNIYKLNKDLPNSAREQAINQLLRIDTPDLLLQNQYVHSLLVKGVTVTYSEKGENKSGIVRLIDFANPENNDFLVVNQYTVIEGLGHQKRNRRPDIVVFVNGLPLVVIELKNPADEKTEIEDAYNQLQTYKQDIPSLFRYNELLVISDGLEAQVGSLSANFERFIPWRTIDGDTEAAPNQWQIEILIRGLLHPARLLDYIRYFITFEDDGSNLIKKSAAYHQFHAVNTAVNETVRATGETGDSKIGVVWHTQGSGKSLTMLFYSAKIIQLLNTPTILVLTDRNDLDGQLFNTFALSRDLLRDEPKQAQDRLEIRDLLKTRGGGVIFSTIQKFLPGEDESEYPVLTERKNVIVIADEAHRSQYSFQKSAKVTYNNEEKMEDIAIKEGFAAHIRKALPNASFIGFTGTPIDLVDRNTVHVFGNYISVYDISQAIKDRTTVPIYYESRLAKLKLNERLRPEEIDEEFEEITEDEELYAKEKLKAKWSRVAEIVGDEDRLVEVANDIVTHYENRLDVIEGKAMIVCMTRDICARLYDKIIAIRPDWHSDDPNNGVIKVIMSGSASDAPYLQKHEKPKRIKKQIEKRMKDPEDILKIVIVRDMWLTGFDVPSLHTMYIDKPMQGHNLMQAIARVNRVWNDKPAGLIVDYIGIGYFLKQALSKYSSPSRSQVGIDQEEAVQLMLTWLEVCREIFHGFDYNPFFAGSVTERLRVLPNAIEFILQLEGGEGKTRYLDALSYLNNAFSLAIPHPKAINIRDEVAFFQAVRTGIIKTTVTKIGRKRKRDIDYAIRQLVSRAVVSDEVIDIFEAAGLDKPEISILSDEFLDEIKDMPQKNLAVEMMHKLLNDEIKSRQKKNVVQARSFADLLQNAINRYQNRTIEASAIIEEMINLAKDIKKAKSKGEELGLSDDEVAFYDAIATNESAVREMPDDTLKQISKELVNEVRNSASIDFTKKASVQARMRRSIKRLLRKYKYPPDQQDKAIKIIMEQAMLFGEEWATMTIELAGSMSESAVSEYQKQISELEETVQEMKGVQEQLMSTIHSFTFNIDQTQSKMKEELIEAIKEENALKIEELTSGIVNRFVEDFHKLAEAEENKYGMEKIEEKMIFDLGEEMWKQFRDASRKEILLSDLLFLKQINPEMAILSICKMIEREVSYLIFKPFKEKIKEYDLLEKPPEIRDVARYHQINYESLWNYVYRDRFLTLGNYGRIMRSLKSLKRNASIRHLEIFYELLNFIHDKFSGSTDKLIQLIATLENKQFENMSVVELRNKAAHPPDAGSKDVLNWNTFSDLKKYSIERKEGLIPIILELPK